MYSYDGCSEIILICYFDAQETFIIINVERVHEES